MKTILFYALVFTAIITLGIKCQNNTPSSSVTTITVDSTKVDTIKHKVDTIKVDTLKIKK